MIALTLIALSAATPDTAKLFTDKGSTYFRTDHPKALTVGAELSLVAEPGSSAVVGKAVVMELSGKLARVSLDDEGGKGKFVLLPKPKVGVAGAVPPLPGKPAGPTGPVLKGSVEHGALRVTVNNQSDDNWSGCTLLYSDGSSYPIGEVVKHSDDTVMKVKFKSAPVPLYDHLLVTCAEGESRFYFDKPTAPVGSLRGYAVNEGGGSVVVYNSSGSAWTQCDVKKPDRSHYVLGTLKGGANDSIHKGRFVKEAEGPLSWLDLRCKEGYLRQKL